MESLHLSSPRPSAPIIPQAPHFFGVRSDQPPTANDWHPTGAGYPTHLALRERVAEENGSWTEDMDDPGSVHRLSAQA